jgi:hypothetical protein
MSDESSLLVVRFVLFCFVLFCFGLFLLFLILRFALLYFLTTYCIFFVSKNIKILSALAGLLFIIVARRSRMFTSLNRFLLSCFRTNMDLSSWCPQYYGASHSTGPMLYRDEQKHARRGVRNVARLIPRDQCIIARSKSTLNCAIKKCTPEPSTVQVQYRRSTH